jgi:hypothetical protein
MNRRKARNELATHCVDEEEKWSALVNSLWTIRGDRRESFTSTQEVRRFDQRSGSSFFSGIRDCIGLRRIDESPSSNLMLLWSTICVPLKRVFLATPM